jgi:hypothetical protein
VIRFLLVLMLLLVPLPMLVSLLLLEHLLLIASVVAGISVIAGVPFAVVVPILFEGVAFEDDDPTVMFLASLPLPTSQLLESGHAADGVPAVVGVPAFEGVLALVVDTAVTLPIFLLLLAFFFLFYVTGTISCMVLHSSCYCIHS